MAWLETARVEREVTKAQHPDHDKRRDHALVDVVVERPLASYDARVGLN